MQFMTGHALQTWQRVKELHLRIQTSAPSPEGLARLHAELRDATEVFRRAYAEELVRRRVSASPRPPSVAT